MVLHKGDKEMKKKIILGIVLGLTGLASAFTTKMITRYEAEKRYETLADEYETRLSQEKDKYRSELTKEQEQYESELKRMHSSVLEEMHEKYMIRFYVKGKCDDEFHYTYPCVYDMENKELQNKINENLIASFCDWKPEKDKYYNFSSAKVKYSSKDYLSVGVILDNKSDADGRIDIYNTVNMETGELINLDDLVEIDEELVDSLLSDEILIRNWDYPEKIKVDKRWKQDDYYDYCKNELMNKLMQCSQPYDNDNYEEKPTFYLGNNRLYLRNIYDDNCVFYVELDDIEDKLKVEKW